MVDVTDNGRITKDEQRKAIDAAAERVMPKAMAWMKRTVIAALIVGVVLPALGLSAVMFAYAYSLVAR